MSGLPPYHSSPEAQELWEITGALDANYYWKQVYEGTILDCSVCPYRESAEMFDDEDWPWSCPNECSQKKYELEWKDLDAEEGFGDFWASIEEMSISPNEVRRPE